MQMAIYPNRFFVVVVFMQCICTVAVHIQTDFGLLIVLCIILNLPLLLISDFDPIPYFELLNHLLC